MLVFYMQEKSNEHLHSMCCHEFNFKVCTTHKGTTKTANTELVPSMPCLPIAKAQLVKAVKILVRLFPSF